MYISKIELNFFRNYSHLRLEPYEGINIFYGKNGSGKTNLLEAVHYCSLGKSHRVNQDQNVVMMNEKGAACKILIQGIHYHEIEIRLSTNEDSVKNIWIDGKKAGRLSEMMGILRCVIFSPEDLELIKEGPSARRKFLDMMISQINSAYFIALQQYRNALNQRNALIRLARINQTRPDPMIEDFEKTLSDRALYIFRERDKYVKMMSETGSEIYRKISGDEEENFSVQYHPSFHYDSEISFQSVLKNTREEDIRKGTTTIGPHRDDLLVFLNQQNMKLYASQGQVRTGALSMKLSQVEIFRKMTGEDPVLLLDDVMSELDLRRRMNLLDFIRNIQTFITCTDIRDLEDYPSSRTFHVFSMDGQANIEIKQKGPVSRAVLLKEPDWT